MNLNKYFTWVTPSGNNKIALCRFKEWVIVYPNEFLFIHKDHLEELIAYGFIEVERPIYYKTEEEYNDARRVDFVIKPK